MARCSRFIFISVVVPASCMQFHGIPISPSDTSSDEPTTGSLGEFRCSGPGTAEFKSLETAQDSCSSNPSCNFIWSPKCDGTWAVCENSGPVESSGEDAVCTKTKPTSQIPIGRGRMKDVHSQRSFLVRQAEARKEKKEFLNWRICDKRVHSNLGGLGPDAGEMELRIYNVTNYSNRDVDLVITNTSEYLSTNAVNNGIFGCFGRINLPSTSSVGLRFRFVFSGTHEEVEFPRVPFTVYDLDGSSSVMKPRVSFDRIPCRYWVSGSSGFRRIDDSNFVSEAVGELDNPSDPNDLNTVQLDRSLMASESYPEYSVTFSTDGQPTNTDIQIFFSGRSSVLAESGQVSDTNRIEENGTCAIWADPHVSGFDNDAKGPVSFLGGVAHTFSSTFDGQPIDVNSYETGDFWLMKNAHVQIQGRYTLSKEFGGDRAAVGALAIGGSFINGSKLLVEPKNGTITWDGWKLGERSRFELGDVSIPVLVETYYDANRDDGTAPSGVDVSLPRSVFLRVRRYNTHLDLRITATRRLGAVDGQCGNFNGDAQDDTLEHIKGRMQVLTVAPEDSLFSP